MKRLSSRDIERACREDHGKVALRKTKAQKLLTKQAGQPVEPAGDLPIVHKGEDGVPIKCWATHVERGAMIQLERMAQLPIIHPQGLAVMPDVHPGVGACVGSVIPMRGALVPSAVGLDAGCGMVAVKLDMNARDLPDNLRSTRFAIEAAVPVGTGGIHEYPADEETWKNLEERYQEITARHPQVFKKTAALQLGTLGAGNHFIEICLDDTSGVWVMIHSGSRGAGGMIGQHFIRQAQRHAREHGIELPDKALSWLPEGCNGFDDYVAALLWAQDYARDNRKVMLRLTLKAMENAMGRKIRVTGEAINCHHNYAVRERHFGEDLWITRKGAIRAGVGEMGIIPGSMGTESFIVRGKGAADSYCSSSHGAGRVMSRKTARENFTSADLRKQTAGVECRKDRSVIDEIPGAYKDINRVMAEQHDLVEIVHTLRQVVCVKGS